MSLWPIYVPSHGRSGRSQTLDWIASEPVQLSPVYICVERQELEDYARTYQKFTVIENTVKPHTIVGARQSILNHAREKGSTWYWQIDDTVTGLGLRKIPGAKAHLINPIAALFDLQNIFSIHPKVALISPDFRHLAWGAAEPFKLNTRCMVITGTRADTGLNYDLDMLMKEDIDFCLTTLSAGWVTVLSHLHEISEVPMGANKIGGMTEKYSTTGFHDRSCQQMMRKWPRYCSLAFRHGRPEIKTSWKTFLLKKNKV